MSIPIRIVVDWEKVQVCEDCAKKLAGELLKQVRKGTASLDVAKLLCDECWEWNVEKGYIRSEIDPRMIRK